MQLIAFDAKLQKDTAHEVVVDNNGELVLTSIESGSFFKLEANLTKEQYKELLAKHKEANEGQLSIEQSQKAVEELVADLAGLQELADEQSE